MKIFGCLVVFMSFSLAFASGDEARLSGDPLSNEVLKISSAVLGQRDAISQVLKSAGVAGDLRFWRALTKRTLQDSSEKTTYTLETQACADITQVDSCSSIGALIIEETVTQNGNRLDSVFTVLFDKNLTAANGSIYDDALLLASVVLLNRDKISQDLKRMGVESPVKFSRGTVNQYVPRSFDAAKMTVETKMCSDVGVSEGCYWVLNFIVERQVGGTADDPKITHKITYKGSGLG